MFTTSKICVALGYLLISLVVAASSEKCTTPNGERAECVPLYSCTILLNALATQQTASMEFAQKSNCGGTAVNPMVCCGTTSTFATKTTLLPDKSYCGYQHSDDYIRGTDYTSAINEFPWFANLLYTNNTNNLTLCGGAIISLRYVLTAANCLVYRQKYDLIAVRLGEYSLKNHTDCVGTSDFRECTEVQDFGIEKIIPHAEYNKRMYHNDIGLLRLNQSITYNDYIRPICLPLAGTLLAMPGDTVTTTGWGPRGNPTETKKKILAKLLTNDQCLSEAQIYKPFLTENKFCTKSLNINEEFSCYGDGGSPVMFATRNQWHMEGVASFGGTKCNVLPETYTKIVNYMDWILNNMEP